jgi:hypothetical protein
MSKRKKGHLSSFVPLIRTTLASPAWKQYRATDYAPPIYRVACSACSAHPPSKYKGAERHALVCGVDARQPKRSKSSIIHAGEAAP